MKPCYSYHDDVDHCLYLHLQFRSSSPNLNIFSEWEEGMTEADKISYQVFLYKYSKYRLSSWNIKKLIILIT